MKTYQIEISVPSGEENVFVFLTVNELNKRKGRKNVIVADNKQIVFSHPITSIEEVDYQRQEAYAESYLD